MRALATAVVDAGTFFLVASGALLEEEEAQERLEDLQAVILDATPDERAAVGADIQSRLRREPSDEVRGALDELLDCFNLNGDAAA